MKKYKKLKHSSDFYLRRSGFFLSCCDAFEVMVVIAFIMLITGTFDTLFPFGNLGLYSIFIMDALCTTFKWLYYKKYVKAVQQEMNIFNSIEKE